MTLVETTNAEITPVGIQFTDNMSIDEWTAIGERLEQHDRNLRWAIGDWLVFGSERFGARAAVIADSLSLSTGSVANAASVCRRVPFERRRPELSFSHHEEVAHLDETGQARMLDLAVKEGLSKSVLRSLVHEEEHERKAARPARSTNRETTTEEPAADDTPPAGRVQGPVTLTLVLAGEQPGRELVDEGVGKVVDALRTWFVSHGYDTTVEVR